MTRTWVSATTKSFLAFVAAVAVSSGAAAQIPFGGGGQNPLGGLLGGAPAQNPFGGFGFNPSQNLSGAPTQNPYGVPAQSPYANPPPPSSNVYAYPSQGQSQEQLARDRYECQNWAVGQTGFDPTRSPQPGAVASPQTTNVGNNLAGSAIQSLGGSLGGGVGGIAAQALAGQLSPQQGNVGAVQPQQASTYATQVDGYRRAQTACLQARGYTVN